MMIIDEYKQKFTSIQVVIITSGFCAEIFTLIKTTAVIISSKFASLCEYYLKRYTINFVLLDFMRQLASRYFLTTLLLYTYVRI